jgi:hypothetical protein
VKRFFVSEARRAELENLTEYRQSGAPGDFSGASFWYFLREKVLRVFRDLRKWIPAGVYPCGGGDQNDGGRNGNEIKEAGMTNSDARDEVLLNMGFGELINSLYNIS